MIIVILYYKEKTVNKVLLHLNFVSIIERKINITKHEFERTKQNLKAH